MSDVSYDELHAFAGRLGIPRRAFQGDHYDIPDGVRSAALGLGAEAVGSRELLLRLRGAGLRLRPAARSLRGSVPGTGMGTNTDGRK